MPQRFHILKLTHRKISQISIHSCFMPNYDRLSNFPSQWFSALAIWENHLGSFNPSLCPGCALDRMLLQRHRWIPGMDNFLSSQEISACYQNLRATVLTHSSSYWKAGRFMSGQAWWYKQGVATGSGPSGGWRGATESLRKNQWQIKNKARSGFISCKLLLGLKTLFSCYYILIMVRSYFKR